MNSTTAPGGGPELGLASRWLNSRRAFVFLGAYFLLQTLLRVLISDSAELDESHQLLCVQDWRWGYGSDPPLYTWLQRSVFSVVGSNILGLAFLKNLLLLTAFVFTYLGAKEISGNERVSVLAMLSLFLFPQITWESQRDLTHSVLATACAAATFFVAARLAKSKAPLDYVLLGVCAGLGTLSKYSYCLFALALGTAALTIPRFRSVLVNKWILASLAVFLAVVAFHLSWIVVSPELAWKRPHDVIRDSDKRLLMGRLLGLVSIAKCAVMVGGVISAVCLSLFYRGRGSETDQDLTDAQRWIGRTLLVVLALSFGVVLWLGIELKDRWFQPVVFLLAIGAASLAWHQITPAAERRFCLLIGSVALLVLLLVPAIPLSASITRRPTRLNAPFSTLSAQLRGSVGEPDVVVASTRLVGGNLKLYFPTTTVMSPEFRTQAATNTQWLVVWDATKSAAPSQALIDMVMQLRGFDISEADSKFTEAFCKYTRAKSMKLGYLRLP